MAEKDVYSHLISVFLHHVEYGRIVAEPNSEAETALADLVEALRKIRWGYDPDDALQIERSTGRPSKRYSFPLAYKIDHWKAQKEKWATIEVLANEWLIKKGFQTTLTQGRLKNLYKEQKPKVDAHRQAVEQAHRINNK